MEKNRDQQYLDRPQRVVIPAEDWDRFTRWVGAPAKEVPALVKLAVTHPAWQD